MQDWYLYSNNNKAENLNTGLEGFDSLLETCLESYDVVFTDELEQDVVETVIMQGASPESVNTSMQKKMLSRMTSNPVGQIITYKGLKWLPVNKMIDDNGIYKSTKIQICQTTLKWKDAYGEIQETPCVQKLTEEHVAQEEDLEYIAIENNKSSILIQSNPKTREFFKGMRFIISGEVSKITKIQNQIFPNLLFITIEED